MRAPIALFAFNRPETTARVFDAVRAARPSRLFLVCDGPRAGREGEAERCAEVRRLLERVDWPCAVERDYADANMGCRRRISSGISWVFSRTEEAIFLEDDTLPDASFFPYCDELLERYRDDERVHSISGYNPEGESPIAPDSYWYSAHPRIWGWAAWRRSWTGYDVSVERWPAFKGSEAWRRFPAVEREAFGSWLDAVHAGQVDTWDAQFVLLGWQRSALTVIPRRNLVMNIGFGEGATNTAGAPLLYPRQSWPMEFPLAAPARLERSTRRDGKIVRAEHAIHGTELGRAARRRLRETARYYRGRAQRWARVLLERCPGTAVPAPGRRRVLVVRLDAIGDFVLWTGAARALRAWLGPDVHVTLAANAVWAELARDATIADDVWAIERGPLEHDGRYRAGVRERVRGGGFSMAINPRHTREMLLGDSLIRWSCAAERVGAYGDDALLPPGERRWADGWYSRLLPSSRAGMHEAERHAEFLRHLGVPLAALPEPQLTARDLPPALRDALPERYFVVFPGASVAEHRWPAQHFAEAASHVQRATGWRPVLLGSSTDAPVTGAVAAELLGALDLAGRTSIGALVAVIQRARLVLTNDTAAVHLAAATCTHAVCVAGGWHWDRFVPYPPALGAIAARVHAVSMVAEMPCFRCRGYCVLPHQASVPRPCLDRLDVSRVVATVDHVLSLPDMQSDG